MIIFKLIALTFLYTVTLTANAREYHYPPAYEVKGEFYPVMFVSFFSFKRPLDEKIFFDLPEERLSNDSSVIRKIKMDDLKLGIKEGDTAYYVNFGGKAFFKYVFKDYANVLIYASPQEDYTWGRYNVLLTENEEELKRVSRLVSSPYTNGFVYVGNDIDFSNAEFVKVPLEKVKSKDQVPKEFLKNGKFDHLRISNYFQDTFILLEGTPHFWNRKKDEVVSGAPQVFEVPRDLSHLEFIKLSNGMMLLPLGDWERRQGLRLMVIDGDKYKMIDVKFNAEWPDIKIEKKN